MRGTCLNCGTDGEGDCPICHKYDDSDYVMDDSKPPRVIALEKELAEARAEIERLALEIENKQYTITCAAEENQQLKESLAEARAEIESLTKSLTIVANWENVNRTYTANEVKEFARGILGVAALEAAERGE